MDFTEAFVLLLGCCSVWPTAPGQSVIFSVVFSEEIWLLVSAAEADCEGDVGLENKTTGPSFQILSSALLSQDRRSSHLLVCLLTALNSSAQDVMWWVDDTPVTSSGAQMSLMRSENGGAYSAISVWEVSASDWKSNSTYWCGTIHKEHVYREKLCWQEIYQNKTVKLN
uniref:Ig lambda-1 chain C region n=1 Tax=Monopterus albus TaxID=43700 RepID=UPI003D7C3717